VEFRVTETGGGESLPEVCKKGEDGRRLVRCSVDPLSCPHSWENAVKQ
jgi:hypothetical protein